MCRTENQTTQIPGKIRGLYPGDRKRPRRRLFTPNCGFLVYTHKHSFSSKYLHLRYLKKRLVRSLYLLDIPLWSRNVGSARQRQEENWFIRDVVLEAFNNSLHNPTHSLSVLQELQYFLSRQYFRHCGSNVYLYCLNTSLVLELTLWDNFWLMHRR